MGEMKRLFARLVDIVVIRLLCGVIDTSKKHIFHTY